MTEGRTFKGKTLDEALTEACSALRARVGELHYELVRDGDDNAVTIEAEVDPIAVLGLFLSESSSAGELDIRVRLKLNEEVLTGELSGEDVRHLTASGGRGLDALQYLSNRILNRRLSEHLPVHLDCSGFKDRRAKQLQEKAYSAAEDAHRKRQEVVLGPLTPAARREIHLALADDPDVETESDGEGFLKRVVVRPRGRR